MLNTWLIVLPPQRTASVRINQNQPEELLIDSEGRCAITGSLREGAFDIQQQGSRILLTISSQLMKRVGDRDIVSRSIFPEVYDGSYPARGSKCDDGGYIIEITVNDKSTANAQLNNFLDLIEIIAANARPSVDATSESRLVVDSLKNRVLSFFKHLFS